MCIDNSVQHIHYVSIILFLKYGEIPLRLIFYGSCLLAYFFCRQSFVSLDQYVHLTRHRLVCMARNVPPPAWSNFVQDLRLLSAYGWRIFSETISSLIYKTLEHFLPKNNSICFWLFCIKEKNSRNTEKKLSRKK